MWFQTEYFVGNISFKRAKSHLFINREMISLLLFNICNYIDHLFFFISMIVIYLHTVANISIQH